jgi:hypothetical protein
MLDYLGADVPPWMDGESLLDADTFSETRQLFGVSDVQETTGPSGRRSLRDGGSRNFGASAVMMVAGTHVFELNLIEGRLTSRRVDGRTDGPRRSLSDDEARAAMIARITAAGFEVQRPAVFAAGVLPMTR